jgi:phospholipase A2
MSFKTKMLILWNICLLCPNLALVAMDKFDDWYSVDCSNSISVEEAFYQKKRSEITKATIEGLIGLRTNAALKMPRVGMCCSGGGVRAQVATLGFLSGAETIGLLDAVSDLATLSGSTWAIIPWILHRMPPIEYSHIVKKQLQFDFWDVKNLTGNSEPHGFMICKIIHALMNYKFSIKALWGNLIARRLLNDLEDSSLKQLTFADIRKILDEKNAYPFPIFTTLIAETQPNYEGLEVTPYTAYSSYLSAEILTESLGSTFVNGTCKEPLPEKPLSFYMGMFGSAYAASLTDAIKSVSQDLCDRLNEEDAFIQDVQPLMARLLEKFNTPTFRISPAKVPNFTYKMQPNKMHKIQNLHLLDYGINFNLPIFPFLRKERRPDILIICDASSDASDCDFTQLKNAQAFAKQQKAKFPSLTKFKNITPNLKIFYEYDPTVPLVIYVANQTEASTLDMNYDEEQFDSIYRPMVETITKNKYAIIEAIKFKTSQINQQLIPNRFDALA